MSVLLKSALSAFGLVAFLSFSACENQESPVAANDAKVEAEVLARSGEKLDEEASAETKKEKISCDQAKEKYDELKKAGKLTEGAEKRIKAICIAEAKGRKKSNYS